MRTSGRRFWGARPLLAALRVAFCWLLVPFLTCCASGPRVPVPVSLQNQAYVAGMGTTPIRFWGDQLPPNANQMVKQKWQQEKAANPDIRAGGRHPVVNFLAISGGGSDGAFGAGILCGWTAAGTRPKFDVVTGVSTGALTAPFAFLGPKYDQAVKDVFTKSNTRDIALSRPVRGLLGGDSLQSNAPLAKVIAHYVTPEFMAEVAAEYRKGRRLLIGTTNLDAERPVIWDMGAIANSGRPEALQLFRTVLLSSAAIPAVFPPGFIKVSADGATYEEMHVDGGATREMFLVPTQFMASKVDRQIGIDPIRRAYIIRNGHVSPEYEAVKPRTLSIAGRAVSSLIKSQGVGDLSELYVFARKNGIGYHVTYIPGDFKDTSTQEFDPVYMTKLFDLGYELGKSGRAWQKTPPSFGQ